VLDVAARAGEEIVDAENLGAFGQQAVAKMRAEEAGAPGHQNAVRKMTSHFSPHRHSLRMVLSPACRDRGPVIGSLITNEMYEAKC
jgi:hypothetical protein